MADFIVDFVDFNETLDYQKILVAAGIYLLSLWIVVTIWVLIDAKRRFRSNLLAFIWMLLVLIMNLPALIVYLIVRPDDVDWTSLLSEDQPKNDLILPVTSLPNGGKLLISLEFNGNQIVAQPYTPNVESSFNYFQKYFSKQNTLRSYLLS